MSEQEEGWGWPVSSKKAHYFVNRGSTLWKEALCGRWIFFEPVEQGNDDSPDNCAECKKRLKRRRVE